MEESDWEKIADSYKRESYSLSRENKELKEKVANYESALKRIDWHTRTIALKHVNWMAVEALNGVK